jgi:hypothetical protein
MYRYILVSQADDQPLSSTTLLKAAPAALYACIIHTSDFLLRQACAAASALVLHIPSTSPAALT